jgi:hypothetical protein
MNFIPARERFEDGQGIRVDSEDAKAVAERLDRLSDSRD